MIQPHTMTVIDNKTYRCLKIEDGYAYLKDITQEQGRPMKIKVEECPYIDADGQYVTPVVERPKKKRTRSMVNITRVIKENTDFQISRSAKNFIHEWVETAVGNIIANAEHNARAKGHTRISAAHIFWLETNKEVKGYWKENEDYIRD